jgi:hypothetical protein
LSVDIGQRLSDGSSNLALGILDLRACLFNLGRRKTVFRLCTLKVGASLPNMGSMLAQSFLGYGMSMGCCRL